MHPRVGSQPVGVGAPPARALARVGPRRGGGGRPGAHPDRRAGHPPSAALPLQRCAIGWEELAELAAPCDPAWTESQTGVPAADIERAAHLYGPGPSLLWIGQGLQRQPSGGNVVRSVAALPAMTGNVGRPGAGFLYLNGFGNRGVDEDDLSGARAYPEAPEAVSHMDLAALLEDRERSRALVCWNVNPAASCPE